MPPTIEYASPTIGSRDLQRYFVYAIDAQTMRTVRFEIEARGLPNLAYLLKDKNYAPELIVVSPDASVPEPPDFGIYLDEISAAGDAQLRATASRLVGGQTANRLYPLIPKILDDGDARETSLDPKVVLRTEAGFVMSGRSGILVGEGPDRLARWGLACGSITAGLGAIAIGAVLILLRIDAAAATLLVFTILILYVLPGSAILVMGLDQFKRMRWVPIVASVLGALLLMLSTFSFLAGILRGEIVGAVISLALVLLSGRYLIAAVIAMRG